MWCIGWPELNLWATSGKEFAGPCSIVPPPQPIFKPVLFIKSNRVRDKDLQSVHTDMGDKKNRNLVTRSVGTNLLSYSTQEKDIMELS